MYLISEEYFKNRRNKSIAVRAVVLLAVYLGINSNLYQNGILAIYTGLDLIARWLAEIRKKEKDFGFKDSLYHFLILGIWAGSLIFEYFGGRSQQVGAPNFSVVKHQMKETGLKLLENGQPIQ